MVFGKLRGKQVSAQVRVHLGAFRSPNGSISDQSSFMVWLTRKDKHAEGTRVHYPKDGVVSFDETITFRMTLVQKKPGVFGPKPFTLQVQTKYRGGKTDERNAMTNMHLSQNRR